MKTKLVTIALIVIAAVLAGIKYQHYISQPWTRDAQVRANIIEITPRVTGPVTQIYVNDNQRVRAGELLFEIDDSVYLAASHQAKASLAQAKVVLSRANNELKRMSALEKRTPGAVPVITLNNLLNDVESANANLQAAVAVLDNAELNVKFTKIYASKDGYITNFNIAEGAHVVANQPVVALIDEASFWVEGFFKETDIQAMQQGDTASITLMSYPNNPLTGTVVSIGYGIAQSDGSTSTNLLPNVNPNFEWIRLAQRLPVKIAVNALPKNVQLRVGTTASVMINQRSVSAG
ncbi:HlyD family secretion protein [Agarivorans sp. 1_MG-2023]|uniref:HlyD family secretion protein n=1 Tax=Agarivorans sp. 1_MG-2023 TaxID=3062634 RepID=UPI0026E3DC50|nr:HlyD family secretion protein [Agarivorans sp. 1_MG-2023]MDO6762145.1 HlyD family secretion protein [Agarivorans sp. 1_MG-2023]